MAPQDAFDPELDWLERATRTGLYSRDLSANRLALRAWIWTVAWAGVALGAATAVHGSVPAGEPLTLVIEVLTLIVLVLPIVLLAWLVGVGYSMAAFMRGRRRSRSAMLSGTLSLGVALSAAVFLGLLLT